MLGGYSHTNTGGRNVGQAMFLVSAATLSLYTVMEPSEFTYLFPSTTVAVRTRVIRLMVQISYESSSSSTSFDPLPWYAHAFQFLYAVWRYMELDCFPHWVALQSVIPRDSLHEAG